MKFAILVVLFLSLEAWSQDRAALLVSSPEGREDQPRLRHTSKDVSRMVGVLTELGGVEAVTRLERARSGEVLQALATLSRREKPIGLFVFYYSGHADAQALQLGQSALPLEKLLEEIRRVPAELRLVLLDACQSGAATRRKGVQLGPPVDVRIDAQQPGGEILITSSSADELSYESDHLGGAIFTLHWVSGLRGAADVDSDGIVTLSEAYRYAYARTLSATLMSTRGPQRPTFRWEVTGQREPVLATLRALSRLTLQASRPGLMYVLDAAEDSVLAEVNGAESTPVRLALPPGEYVVRQRGARDVRSARVKLSPGDDRVLEDAQMATAPFVRLARKGGLGRWAAVLGAGQVAAALGHEVFLGVSAGGELERGPLLYSVRGQYFTGSHQSFDLNVQQRTFGVTGQALWGVTFGDTTLRAGPSVGFLSMHQAVTGRTDVWGWAAQFGAVLRLDVEVSGPVGLYLMGDVQGWVGPAKLTGREAMTIPIGNWGGLFGAAGWGAGLRAAF